MRARRWISDARTRTYAGHGELVIDDRSVRLVPLRAGTKPIGLLASSGRSVEAGTLDALAGLVALAIERARLLDERKAAELTRHSEELKTALLASLGHDLRTPLAAIRVAATNIGASDGVPRPLAEQSDVILTEAERLSRLFENILEMARLDAGSVHTEARWTHPSEILDAARRQVEQALAGHPVHVRIDRDEPARLDARLTASAVAHLLENAAQYSPPGTAIEVVAGLTDAEVTISVRDHGPGLSPADLPHVFERFYRGAGARHRTSGTGMGLSIARELLAVAGGQVSAQNAPDGGARFTVTVPAAIRPDVETASPTA
ncbi:MAG: ATP-binding protein [Vicinamibacterales bacterium]